jgi:hypothetical protein
VTTLDIGDEIVVTRADQARAELAARGARAAELARTGATRGGKAAGRGTWALARRYGRGLRNAGSDAWSYWFDIPGLQHIAVLRELDPAKTKDAEEKHDKRVTRNRATAACVLLSSLVWCTGGLVTIHDLTPGAAGVAVVAVLYLLLAGLPLLAGWIVFGGKHKNGWLWPVSFAGVDGVLAVAIYVHQLLHWPVAAMFGGWLAVASVWFLIAGRDGDLFADVEVAQATIGAAVVTPPNRLVEQLNEAVGEKGVTAADWRVTQGLRKVDDYSDDIVLQTPGRITTKQVVAALPRFASLMGRPQSWITIAEHGAEGVVRITIANRDQWEETRDWPLVEAERFSVWRPMPLAFAGTTTIVVTLMFAGWLIAAVPRVGKTFSLRLLVLAWLLDPTTDVAVFDLKGGRDFLMCKPMCVAFGHGRADETIVALRDYLKWVLEVDGPVRKAAFNALTSDLVPAGQLTEAAVAADSRLRPLLIAVDEMHWATTHEELGEEIVDLMSKIAKDLPYLGVELALASQRLDAKETAPTKLRNVLSNRIGLKLHSSQDSAMILGDAANRLGFNASELPKVKGLCILHGADDASSLDGYLKAKTFLCDGLQAERVAARALSNRQRAEVVPAQEPEEPPAPELLAVARILREHRASTSETSMRSEDVATRLETTAQRLRDRTGVRARQNASDAYRRHLYLEDVEAAIEGRQGTRPSPLRVVG